MLCVRRSQCLWNLLSVGRLVEAVRPAAITGVLVLILQLLLLLLMNDGILLKLLYNVGL